MGPFLEGGLLDRESLGELVVVLEAVQLTKNERLWLTTAITKISWRWCFWLNCKCALPTSYWIEQ